MHLEDLKHYDDEEPETLHCLAYAILLDDPSQNNITCPWNWKEDAMAVLNDTISKRLAGISSKAKQGGLGYHDMILMSAKVLQEAGVTEEQARILMHKASASVKRRPLQPGEINKAIKWAYNSDARPSEYKARYVLTDWPLISEYKDTMTVDQMSSKSSTKPQSTNQVLVDLFDADEKIYLTDDPRAPGTIFNPSLGDDYSKFKYICPSPLIDENGSRVKENIKLHKYIVYESDLDGIAHNFDLQAGLICKLETILPLVMVVHSGNKSLHGWFKCAGHEPGTIEEFIKMGIRLGADSSVFRPNQLVRTPLVMRENGNLQDIIYYAG